MPQFTSILADRDASPLTPIPETEQKQPLDDGYLTLTTSPEAFPSASDSASPPSSRNSSTPSSPISSGASSPPTRKVSFPSTESPVTSMSRPLNNAELWPLYHFEQHARACRDCFNPYAVHKENKSLCPTGQEQGATVAQIIYSKCDGQDIFAVSDLGACDLTRVELPRQYVQVRSLLRAVERIVKARRRPEKKLFVDREDESKQREQQRARNPSPDRSSRKEERRHSRRYYRSSSPASDHEPRQRSPPRASRATTRSYHESELPLRRSSSSPSTTSSSSSSSPVRSKPIDIIPRRSSAPSAPQTRPFASALQTDIPKITVTKENATYNAPKSSATYPPTTLPFRRRSLTDGPSNCFPSRRASLSGPTPPSSYKYSSSTPFRPSPLAATLTRSPSRTQVPTLSLLKEERDQQRARPSSSGGEKSSDSGRSSSSEGSVYTSRGFANVEVRRPGGKRS